MPFYRRNSGGRGRGGGSANVRSYGRSGGGGQGKIKYMRVDPRMLVKKAEPTPSKLFEPKNTLRDLPISQAIKNNALTKGYTSLTPIQDQVIPQILAGRDVIGLAATGTGKTAAFLIPLLDRIERGYLSSEHSQTARFGTTGNRVLIIVPTRELAVQIIEEGRSLARGIRAYFTLVIGGVDINRQVRELSRRPEVVVGTPGRLKDLTERKVLKLAEFGVVVLDEVDRMLDMGFINDMRTLISQMPRTRHSLFFSATMSERAQAVAREFLHDPVTIQIASQRASDNVDQDIVRLNGRNKIEVLHDLLIRPGFEKVLVFGRTKHGMEKLARTLSERGFLASAIHGNKSQSQRQRALTAFKNNQIKVLLATDVASRGIDIDSVTHVINYELPETYDDYIHRIGRTGRADKVGVALTFIE